MDSTIPLLLKYKIAQFVSDLVGIQIVGFLRHRLIYICQVMEKTEALPISKSTLRGLGRFFMALFRHYLLIIEIIEKIPSQVKPALFFDYQQLLTFSYGAHSVLMQTKQKVIHAVFILFRAHCA